jgi:hypothetical protein
MLAANDYADHAVIFVHGYGGHPVKTFSRARDLIEVDDNWMHTDAYFVGYASTSDETMLSAAYLANFLRTIVPDPPATLFKAYAPSVQTWFELRETATKYKTVQIISHSLGAVITRAAILILIRNRIAAAGTAVETLDTDSAFGVQSRADLCLFAPAQGGARLADLVGVASNIIGVRGLVNLYRGKSPTFQELEGGSLVLSSIMNDTNFYADRYPEIPALRARIAWAHHDSIVSAVPYRCDSTMTVLDTDHMSVCKPHPKFRVPFDIMSSSADVDGGGVLV